MQHAATAYVAFSVSDGKETVHRDRSALTRRANTYVHTTLCIRHILRYTMERRISPPSLTNGEYGEREGYRRLYGDNSPEGIALLRHCGFSLDGSGRLGERCVGVLEDLHDAQTAAALLGVRFMKEGYMAEREASRGSASSVEHDSESDVRNMGPAYVHYKFGLGKALCLDERPIWIVFCGHGSPLGLQRITTPTMQQKRRAQCSWIGCKSLLR